MYKGYTMFEDPELYVEPYVESETVDNTESTEEAEAQREAKLPAGLKLITTVPNEYKHENDVVTLLYHNDMLISGADDGFIKVWNKDLSPIASWKAHVVNVYNVAALGDTIYSCSNDGSLKAWEIGTWKYIGALIEENPQFEIIKMYVEDGMLWASNIQGEIFVFKDNQQIAKYYLQEDVQDFLVVGNLVFNARNVDVSVTEMMPAPRFNYMSRGAMIGRFPIRKIGDKICFLSRCARNIYVHASTKEMMFKRIGEIKAHEMTITGMCELSGKENIMISGGYDRNLKAWDLTTLKKLAQIDIGFVVNDLCKGPPGTVYLSSSEGHISQYEFHFH